MAVTPGAFSGGLNKRVYRRGGCSCRRNMSQLVGAHGMMTPELVVVARKKAVAV